MLLLLLFYRSPYQLPPVPAAGAADGSELAGRPSSRGPRPGTGLVPLPGTQYSTGNNLQFLARNILRLVQYELANRRPSEIHHTARLYDSTATFFK